MKILMLLTISLPLLGSGCAEMLQVPAMMQYYSSPASKQVGSDPGNLRGGSFDYLVPNCDYEDYCE
jgi:hypothetical protein